MTKELRTSSGYDCSIKKFCKIKVHKLDDRMVHIHGLSQLLQCRHGINTLLKRKEKCLPSITLCHSKALRRRPVPISSIILNESGSYFLLVS